MVSDWVVFVGLIFSVVGWWVLGVVSCYLDCAGWLNIPWFTRSLIRLITTCVAWFPLLRNGPSLIRLSEATSLSLRTSL